MVLPASTSPSQPDWQEHIRTYRRFVIGVTVFVAHVLVILALLAWWFSG